MGTFWKRYNLVLNRREFISSALAASAMPLGRAQVCPSSVDIVQPTPEQIERIVRINLPTASPFIGAAVGIASPSFGTQIQCIGSLLDQTGNKMSFTTDTPFEIASVTKTFTAMAYEALLQSGAVGPNDTLNRFLAGQLPQAFLNVPLFDLADFTSGFPTDNGSVLSNGVPVPNQNGTVPVSVSQTGSYPLAEMFKFLSGLPFPLNAPGTTYSYSNLGFALLALALQAAAKADSFGDLINDEVLEPLGMVRTQAYGSALSASLPRGYDQSGKQVNPGSNGFPAYYGAGGIVNTPNDMMTWLQFNMGLLSIPALAGVLTPMQTANTIPGSNTTPGLGCFVSDLPGSSPKRTIVQKNGDLSGFCSQTAFLAPEGCSTSSAGAFALVNYHDSAPGAPNSPATEIVNHLLLSMLNPEAYRNRPRGSKDFL